MASGVVIYVVTRDEQLAPESMLAMGARAQCDERRVTVYLPKAWATATLANLRGNGQIGINMTRPIDHKSLQIKGTYLAARDSTDADRELQAVHRAALVEQFALVGVPRSLTRRLVWWPSVAVDVDVKEAFSQTPGPGAGERLPGC